jgi:hypothetical protein
MRILLALTLLLAIAGPARAEDVAMLPLDADARLEIYGQPVASRIARALQTGGVEVIVIKAGMDVPLTRLVIRGRITSGRGSSVAITIEVSNPLDGTLLERLNTTSPSLTEIDKAAADLATRLLPVVRGRLDALAKREVRDPQPPIVTDVPPSGIARRPSPQVLIGIAVSTSTGRDGAAFRGALAHAVDRWTRAASREPREVDASTLHPKLAATTVTSAKAAGGVAFEVLGFSIETHREKRDGKVVQVPLARARVRVRIADPGHVMFDRVIATAAEVLAILRPHMRRMVTAWP